MPGERIVSLVPSLTELVVWLGRGDWLVGRTRFCTEPPEAVGAIRIVGGTKDPKLDRIAELRPSLIVANKEENRREDIEALVASGYEVLLTDPNSVSDAVAMIRAIGQRLGAESKAELLSQEVEAELGREPRRRVRVFVPIWKDPWMALGSETYGNDLLAVCGATNVFGGRARYPEVTLDEVNAAAPSLILLPDEPYPFKASDAASLSDIGPARVVDGKLLWWYGPRLPDAIRTLRALFEEIHP